MRYLIEVNSVSKNIQSKDMRINVVIEQLKCLVIFFEKYKKNMVLKLLHFC